MTAFAVCFAAVVCIAATPMTYWKRPAPEPADKTIDELRTRNCHLVRELTIKDGMVDRLEVLVRERDNRIDALQNKLAQSRAQIRQLDRECEHLAAIAGLG